MELQTAREIIDTLARGIHPVNGEVMPEDSPYNEPQVIRALFTVSQALGAAPAAKPRRELPPNAGKPWSPEDDARLAAAFDAGQTLDQLPALFGRTRHSVEARLVKLGRLQTAVGARFS
ncbi:MAG TPA: hypothetical protein VEA35_06700 [Ramlibacter sp.]|nr:hypothetical protein [Ramlibacter sp.]